MKTQTLQTEQNQQTTQKKDASIPIQSFNQEQNTNSISQVNTSVKQSTKKKPFQNFIISKYEALSDRDFKKVPISYINQIYKMQQIDLMKLHQEASTRQEMSQSSIQFYQTKQNQLQNRGVKMNQTLDSSKFNFNNKNGNSPQSSLSNSPGSSFFQDQSSNSRSLSLIQKLDQTKNIDSIKEENIPIRDEENEYKNKKTSSLLSSPNFSGGMHQANRTLIKTSNVDQRSSFDNINKQFLRQQKLQQTTQQFPNIFKQVEHNQNLEIKELQFRQNFKEWQQQFLRPSQNQSKMSNKNIQDREKFASQNNLKVKLEQKTFGKISQNLKSFTSRNQIDSINLNEVNNKLNNKQNFFQEQNLNSQKQNDYFFAVQHFDHQSKKISSNGQQNSKDNQNHFMNNLFPKQNSIKNQLNQAQQTFQSQVEKQPIKNIQQKNTQEQIIQSPLMFNLQEKQSPVKSNNNNEIQNMQKSNLSQNSFQIQQDGEQDNPKRVNFNAHRVLNKQNLTLQLNKLSKQYTVDVNKIDQDDDLEYLQQRKSSFQSQIQDEYQSPQSDVLNEDLGQQQVKINESKFVLHKPYNYKKNKLYLKNLQKNTSTTSPLASSSQVNKQKNKKSPLAYTDKNKSNENLNKQQIVQQFLQNSPTTIKNKSQFSKQQESLSKISSDEVDEKDYNTNINSIIFRNQEKEMMQNYQIKNEIEEIKTAFVRQILEEQVFMYQENCASLETKIFERKRQEHQINFKANSYQVDQQKVSCNKQFPLLQEIQHLKKNQAANQNLNKSIDLSQSARCSPRNCQTPKVQSIQLEDVFFQVRRSSMQHNKPNLNTQQSLQDQDFENLTSSKNQALLEITRQNSDQNVRRSQFSNINFSQASQDEFQSQSNALPSLKIQISNKGPCPDSSPQMQKRNSKVGSELNKFQSQLNENGSNFSNSSSAQKSGQKQSISMFSKMHNPMGNVNRRQSKIVVFDSDLKFGHNSDSHGQNNNSPLHANEANKKTTFSKQFSNNSDDSLDSQQSNNSKNSFVNFDQKNKNEKQNNESLQTEQKSQSSKQKISTPISVKNNQGVNSNQNSCFEDILKNYYEKLDQDDDKKSLTSIRDPKDPNNVNNQNHSPTTLNLNLNFSNLTKIQNQEMQLKKKGSIQRFQSFESRTSFVNSPKSQSSRIRPQISSSEQPSKQKGLATIYIELNEIMNSHILENLNLSEKLISLIAQFDIKMSNLQQYYAIFLQFVLIDDSKVFNPDTFASFKIHYQVFEQLQIILIETLKSLNYNTHAIEQIIERLEYQKKYIAEGLLVNEIGGSSGILKTVVESLDELNQKLPYNFSHQISAEEKTATLTRVVTIICNQERLYNLNANNYINTIDQKSNFDIEMQPYLHYFKDFGQKEFYCLKLSFYTSLKQRGYRQQTIFRFLEQFEKARYKISSTLTMSNLLKDKQVYNQLVQDYLWKIQQDNQLCQAFENNKEVIQFFCHSVILEFIYSLHGRFDLYFLLSKLPHLNSSHLNKLSQMLTSIVDYRGLSSHFFNDIKIKFLKVSYKLNLDKSPITLIKQENNSLNFLEDLIQEINSIMHKDECFESFIQKFPEDKISLTIADSNQLESGLRALNFFLLTLLSDYDIYSIQDLHSALQAFNVSITIPIQWKIAIEFALNNMKIPQQISQKIIELISLQFSLLYKNTQYEQFNQVLLN